MGEICGAKTRNGSSCKKPAGMGTHHLGKGKCKFHGGSSHGPPKGNKNAQKHGIYAAVFTAEELDQAAAMAGSVDSELAVARIRLANVLKLMRKFDEQLLIESREAKTLAVDSGAEVEKIKADRAKDAKKCGEYYDPDDDDDVMIESSPLEVKTIKKRRDFDAEFIRLTRLIESLERTRLALPQQKAATRQTEASIKQIEAATKQIEAGQENAGDFKRLTSVELDNALLSVIEGFPALLPIKP